MKLLYGNYKQNLPADVEMHEATVRMLNKVLDTLKLARNRKVQLAYKSVKDVYIEGKWVKVEFFTNTNHSDKVAIRQHLIKNDCLFADKSYDWTNINNIKQYLALGPHSRRTTAMWSTSPKQYTIFKYSK